MTTPHHIPDDLGTKAAQSLHREGAAATLSGAIATYLGTVPGTPHRAELLHLLKELEHK
jgi:hypothetical protein